MVVTMEETHEFVTAKSLEEALEQTLNGFPIEQFTYIEITKKKYSSKGI